VGGLSWLDWLTLVLVGLFGIRGLARGTIGQIFGIIGLLTGLWAASWIARWVGEQWSGARPAAVFFGLRWLIAALGGLAVAGLFGWWGDLVGRAVRAGPAGWADRLVGFLFGTVLGAGVAAVTWMVALSLPLEAGTEAWAKDSRFPAPLLRQAARAVSWTERAIPGSDWLEQRFREAARRAS
jgi:membrane protein required for colicin V production